MSYEPIADYGIIGDLHTVALVCRNGCIDWCCLPRFDSPSIFGAILDDQKGGRFQLAATGDTGLKQMYLPNTNILVSRFLGDAGMSEVTDFMPIGLEAGGQTEQESRQLVRIARAIRGPVRFRLECRPAFDYGRERAEVHLLEDQRSAVFASPRQQFVLKGAQPLVLEQGGVAAEFVLQSGEQAVFVLRHREGRADHSLVEEPADGDALLAETARFWRSWVGRSQYHGRWRETVTRSALALKLLTYLPSGAIVAAPTTSLPEQIGGVRNWDYRYTWVRDAAFTVYSLIRLGYTEEAAAFARFIQARAGEPESDNGPLNVLYGIDGRHDLAEETLDHLDGYRGSRPVRVGNAAVGHLQLDIYGELMDSVYLYDKYGAPTSQEMWGVVERLLDWLAGHWEQPDQSIWEVRGGRRQFTYSKLQCWVALDRGLRLGRKRSLPLSGKQWESERDRIYRAIMNEAYNPQERAFTQYFGSDALDASTLMMPLMRFVSPTDPRMVETIDQVRRQLSFDSLVRRYEIGKAARDGLPGGEGFFTVCSFWLVEAMARAGQAEEAQLLFEKLLSFANHLGLFSEEISSKGELLGNFPQALTHLGLISAAYSLDRILDEGAYGQR
ncbi:MAG TPA: glycoside hydrolase family 15 protein [Bryobacteraceae bacterium]|nr:glycoside hydrolase family 15 protein [Bryobacteraceae bacterium]